LDAKLPMLIVKEIDVLVADLVTADVD